MTYVSRKIFSSQWFDGFFFRWLSVFSVSGLTTFFQLLRYLHNIARKSIWLDQNCGFLTISLFGSVYLLSFAHTLSDLEVKLNQADLPQNAQKVVKKELKRIKKMSPQMPEYPMLRHYLELIADLPWNKATKDNIDISKAREVSKTLIFLTATYCSIGPWNSFGCPVDDNLIWNENL